MATAITNATAPRTIKALAAYEPGLTVKPFEYVSRPLGPNDVEIRISHCGVCGTDVHSIQDAWQYAMWPVVPGHEIVGEITAMGDHVSDLRIGDRVGVGAMVFSCQDKANCVDCANDDDPLCNKTVFTYNHTYPDGTKSYGGYADYVRVSTNYAFKIPGEIPSDVAAPLLCAGITVYTPLKEYVKEGMRVGIVGIGGLGHLGLQFAKALGATPVAFSHSPNKEQEAKSLGAEDFVVVSNPEHVAKAAQSVDVMIVTADATNQPYDLYVSCIKKRGKLVMVGAPQDHIKLLPFSFLLSKVSVVGSAIGGMKDMKDMLELAAKKRVLPWIQKLPMSEANQGLALVEQGKPRFRVVLEN